MRAKIELLNVDCMEFMAGCGDKEFDLAICDPPYGIGISGQQKKQRWKKADRKYHEEKGWDKEIPNREYFSELFRVSKNQIIWGGNYFVEYFTEGHKGWIVWDKGQHGLTMSDCELAYSSFDSPTRIWTQNRCILKQEGNTIHPTQKPFKLYKYLLQNYAKPGDTILDTHGGSMSVAIACWDLCYDLTLCELDKDYFKIGKARLERHQAQGQLF